MIKSLFVLIVVFASVIGFGDDYSDEEIRSRLASSHNFIHHEDNVGAFERILIDVGHDTNRIVRLLLEEGESNTNEVLSVLTCLGTLKAPGGLSFVSLCVTNETFGARAAWAALEIGNYSTNSIAIMRRYLVLHTASQRDRCTFCKFLSLRLSCGEFDMTQRMALLEAMQAFAGSANECPNQIDLYLREADPTYERSRRRLSVLQTLSQMEMTDRALVGVTNACHQLEALSPESLND